MNPKQSQSKPEKAQRSKAQKPKKTPQRSQVSRPVPPKIPHRALESPIMVSQARAAGISTNTKEIVYKVERYFDTNLSAETPVNAYYFNEAQAHFSSSSAVGESGNTISRPLSVSAYALPRASNASVASSTYVAACNVQAISSDQGRIVANVQNTVVKPDFNIQWVKIFQLDFNKTFGTTVIKPFTHNGLISLMNVSIVNPDDGTIVKEPVQIRVVTRYAQVMPALATISDAVVPVSSWNTGGTVSASDSYAQVQPVALQNST